MNVPVHSIVRSSSKIKLHAQSKNQRVFITHFRASFLLLKRGGGDSSRPIGQSRFESRKYSHFGRIKVQGVRCQPVSSPDGSHGCWRDKDAAGIMRRLFDGEFYCHWQSFRQHSLSAYGASLWRVRRFLAFLKSTARSP